VNQDFDNLPWRKSTFSATGNDCVELAPTHDAIAMRNSKRPHDGTLVVTRSAITALVDGVKTGDIDDLAL
jgi:Domain of unknown function (DUF397)